MRSRSARLGLALVRGLTLLFAAGCATIAPFSSSSSRQAATDTVPSTMRGDARGLSRSDRLRGDLAYKAAELDAPRPASMQELQPQSLRPQPVPFDITPPSRSGDEPDPRAVIDWLLKERR